MSQKEEITHLLKKRHSLAHVLLMAVKEHFPEALPTIGPVIDTGFYYDIDFGGTKITPEDLQILEKTMKKILAKKLDFKQETVATSRAKELFQQCIEAVKTMPYYRRNEVNKWSKLALAKL